MLYDYRFWLTISCFFLVSAFFSLVLKLFSKKKRHITAVYALTALLASIGVGITLSGSLLVSDFLNPLMAAVLICGMLNGLTPLFIPLVLAAPIVFSLLVHIPLRSLNADTLIVLGTMKFYPSNQGFVSVDWIDPDENENFFTLEGESAALVIQKKSVPAYLFFLKSEIIPLGIVSRSVTMGELPDDETPWFKPFPSEPESESSLYSISYPALKYHSPGFFNTIFIYIRDGQIIQERK